jgi:hypothetical protein
MAELKPGARFASTVCASEMVVVKGAGDIDLRCGGAPVAPVGEAANSGAPTAPFDEGTQIGKRYTTEDESVEVLCTKAGAGSLSIGDVVLGVKGAKPLPSSD